MPWYPMVGIGSPAIRGGSKSSEGSFSIRKRLSPLCRFAGSGSVLARTVRGGGRVGEGPPLLGAGEEIPFSPPPGPTPHPRRVRTRIRLGKGSRRENLPRADSRQERPLSPLRPVGFIQHSVRL